MACMAIQYNQKNYKKELYKSKTMVYAVITAIVFGIVAIAGAVVLIANFVSDWDSLVAKISGAAAIVTGIILFFFIPWSFHTIDAGEIAVVKHMGEIQNVRTPGTYFDFWLTESYQKYDAKVQNVDIQTQAYSKDAQTMDIAMTVQFRVQQDKVKEIAATYGNLDAVENRIESVVAERTKSVLSKYSAMDIIETRADISPEVEKYVKEAIDESYCVDVTTVVLSNIDFSDTFEQTVEDKMVAEQKKLQAEYEKERAIIQAEQELEVARLAARAAIEKANGDAAAQKALAAAEAYATQVKIAKLAQTLGYPVKELTEEQETGQTDEGGNPIKETVVIGYEITWKEGDDTGKQAILDYLKYLEYLSTWNGELPDVVAGENSAQLLIPTTP